MQFNAFYNPQAKEAFQWAVDENDRVKASKILRSAMKMEANTRRFGTHDCNDPRKSSSPVFPRPRPPVKQHSD